MYEQNEHDAFRIAGRLEVALGVKVSEVLDQELERINALVEKKRSTDFYASALSLRRP